MRQFLFWLLLFTLCREYHDLYVLFCVNPLQTDLSNCHYTEIHFQNVTIFQSIFWNVQSPQKEKKKKNYEILPRNLTKAIKYKNYRFWPKMDAVLNDSISLGNSANVLKFLTSKKPDMLRQEKQDALLKENCHQTITPNPQKNLPRALNKRRIVGISVHQQT